MQMFETLGLDNNTGWLGGNETPRKGGGTTEVPLPGQSVNEKLLEIGL